MSYTREDYKVARAALLAARDALEATVENRAYEAAVARLEKVQEETGDANVCENCGDLIFDGDAFTYDSSRAVWNCRKCSPTWADLLANPESFLRNRTWSEPTPMSREEARPLVEAYIARGGSLTDSMATPMGLRSIKSQARAE